MHTDPIAITSETHSLAGTLVLPDGAGNDRPVPAALIVGGPGPLPLERRAQDGTPNWPLRWAEAFGAAGLACLCYDQRGSGESTGLYEDADWDDLYGDAAAAAEILRLQPEVSRVIAVAWADAVGFALRLAAEGKVDGLILLAAGAHTAEERYREQVRRLAAGRGLSDRVVELRVRQWQAQLQAVRDRVAAGERVAETDIGGQRIVTNLRRFLAVHEFDPAPPPGRSQTPGAAACTARPTPWFPPRSRSCSAELWPVRSSGASTPARDISSTGLTRRWRMRWAGCSAGRQESRQTRSKSFASETRGDARGVGQRRTPVLYGRFDRGRDRRRPVRVSPRTFRQ